MKYGSQEYYEEIKTRVNENEELLKKIKELSFKFQNLLTDCPGKVDKLVDWELDKGRIVSLKVEEKAAPSDWRKAPLDEKGGYLMRTVGPWEAYIRLNKKEMTPMQGVSTGLFKIVGNMMKVMPKMGQFAFLTDFMSTIPCEYE